jgi:hypothetical protein
VFPTSEEGPQNSRLYCISKFRDAQRIFLLPGSLRESYDLDPVQFRASLL